MAAPTQMLRMALFLLLFICARFAMAADDPLQSPQCLRALDALQTQEAGATSRLDEDQRLKRQALQRGAAQACLLQRLDSPPPPQRMAQPPLTVAPVRVAPMRLLPPTAAPPALPLPASPVTITACDPTGCWASDGTRLQRTGPGLLGPRGFCSSAAGVLHCP